MGYFAELFLEILLGYAKGTPEKMPVIDYKPSFTVCYNRKKALTKTAVSLIIITVFSLLWIFIKHETRYLFLIFTVLGTMLLILAVISFSYKCSVDDKNIVKSFIGCFKKRILWEDIICIRKVENTGEKHVIIALYGKDGKCTVDLTSDMQNAWYVVKMAEHLGIEIKEERDLTLKELAKL